MDAKQLTVLGDDKRQFYLAEALEAAGYRINTGLDPDAVRQSAAVFCPIPFSRLKKEWQVLEDLLTPDQTLAGGCIPEDVETRLKGRNIRVFDVMKDLRWIKINSALTAEGLLGTIIKNTPFSLKNAKLLLLGYGSCGKAISSYVSALWASVTVYDNSAIALYEADRNGFACLTAHTLQREPEQWDLVVNTVPAPILDEKLLSRFAPDCIFFDIASAPGGFTPSIMERLGLTLHQCPGIPGTDTPKTAGYLLAELVLKELLE